MAEVWLLVEAGLPFIGLDCLQCVSAHVTSSSWDSSFFPYAFGVRLGGGIHGTVMYLQVKAGLRKLALRFGIWHYTESALHRLLVRIMKIFAGISPDSLVRFLWFFLEII